MDEQAAPGVFFNSGGGGGGSGNVKAPHTEAGRAHYNIPGILHFLQHEWARFELERAQWDVERAELQVRAAQGGSISGQGSVCCTGRTLRQTALKNVRIYFLTAYCGINIPDKVTGVGCVQRGRVGVVFGLGVIQEAAHLWSTSGL